MGVHVGQAREVQGAAERRDVVVDHPLMMASVVS
jgi:hypothetical protein